MIEIIKNEKFLNILPSNLSISNGSFSIKNNLISIKLFTNNNAVYKLYINVINIKTSSISFTLQANNNGTITNVSSGDNIPANSIVTLKINDSNSFKRNASFALNGNNKTVKENEGVYTIANSGKWVITLSKNGETQKIIFTISPITFVDNILTNTINISNTSGTLSKSNNQVIYSLNSITTDEELKSISYDQWWETIKKFVDNGSMLKLSKVTFDDKNDYATFTFSSGNTLMTKIENISLKWNTNGINYYSNNTFLNDDKEITFNARETINYSQLQKEASTATTN